MTGFRQSGVTLTALLLAGVLSAGCGSTVLPTRSNDTSDAEIRRLQQRVVKLQQEAVVTQEELDVLRRRVQDLEARMGGAPARQATGSAPKPSPTPPRRNEPIRDLDPPPPPDRTAGNDAILEEVDIEEEFERAPPRRPDVVERSAPVEEPQPASPPSSPPPTPTRVDQPVSTSAQTVYDQGYTQYHQGRYAEAEATFEAFLGDHGATDLADNAMYWIGEARYARGDIEGALDAFRDTVVRYPDGNKVPDALLKAAQALSALGDDAASRETYREIVARFPGSAAAAVAEERLN